MEHLSVAVADDNQRILDMLETVIGMDKDLNLVGKAKNGEEMCQIIKTRQPDVVLLDLIMPKMDGLTVRILSWSQRWDRKGSQKMPLTKAQITMS